MVANGIHGWEERHHVVDTETLGEQAATGLHRGSGDGILIHSPFLNLFFFSRSRVCPVTLLS